jgi:predicted DNA-binding protein with PD1-like motif
MHLMQSHEASINRIILIRVDPREDLLDALERAVAEQGVRNGTFISAAGSLSRYHFHVVSSTDLPPENAFIKGEGPYDILTITGFVLDGRVHAHISFSDDKIAMGGHLEPGCEVLTFAMVGLAEISGVDMADWDRVAKR